MATNRKTPSAEDVQAMIHPVRCMGCYQIHDAAGGVEIVGRYADCTLWVCPHCGRTLDDRPLGWGGNVERIDKKTFGSPWHYYPGLNYE